MAPAPVEAPDPPPAARPSPEPPAPGPAPPVEAPAEPSPSPQEEAGGRPEDLLPGDRRISIELPDATLGEVIRMIARAGSLNLVAADGLDRRVSITLNEVTLRDAVTALLQRYRLRLQRFGDVLFVDEDSGGTTSRPAGDAGSAAAPVASRSFRVASVSASSVEKQVALLLSPTGKLVLNSENNTLFVRDLPERLGDVDRYLSQVDRREKQVVIEAQIFEIGLDRDDERGARVDLSNISLDETTGTLLSDLLAPSTNFNLAWSNDAGSIAAALNALETVASVDLLSAPRVASINGKEAKIEIIEKVPYVRSTSTFDVAGGGSTTATVQEVQFEEVGITLKVNPTIQEDRFVRMAVAPAVSEVKDFFNGVPVVDRRTVTTEVIVKDGGTLFLGGLLREEERQEERRVPILGSIPLLGFFFSSQRTTTRKSNLLILLTPRIFDLDAPAPGVTDHFRSEYDRSREDRGRYPGTRREG
ncbi:MAG TPA: hypothetical protein VFI25_12550 [Planctomycetota bacterium]|nr:hypothetical protein [Planctomycetota bacterium]